MIIAHKTIVEFLILKKYDVKIKNEKFTLTFFLIYYLILQLSYFTNCCKNQYRHYCSIADAH